MIKFAARRQFAPFLFTLFAIALVLSLIYARATRSILLPETLKYIPAQASYIIATGSIKELWEQIDGHFGRAIRDKDSKGFLAQSFRDLSEMLTDKKVPIASVSDIASRGLDVERGLLMGIYPGEENEQEVVLIIPIRSWEVFLKNAEQFFRKTAKVMPCPQPELSRLNITRIKKSLFVQPEPGIGLLASSCMGLHKSISDMALNLQQARENDWFFESVKHYLRRPLQSGPGLFVAGLSPYHYSGIFKFAFGLNFEKSNIHIGGTFTFHSDNIQIINDFFAKPPAEKPWEFWLPENHIGSVVLHDNGLRRYIDFLSTFGIFADIDSNEMFGGLVGELGHLSDVYQIVVFVTGYHGGLPQIVLGIWGHPDDFNVLVNNVRGRLRLNRDRKILEGAIEQYKTSIKNPDNNIPKIPLAELYKKGVLKPEEGAIFEPYQINDGQVSKPVLTSINFQNKTYQISYPFVNGKELKIKYISPKVTDNDILYRFTPDERKGIDFDSLKSDDYRLASLLIDNVLWVATASRDLESMIQSHTDELTGTKAPSDSVILLRSPTNFRKLRGGINVTESIEQGLLSGDKKLEDWVKTNLFDFRNHPRFLFDLEVNKRTHEIYLSLDLKHKKLGIAR